MKAIFAILFICFCSTVFGQDEKYAISGFVRDSSNGEDLYGITVRVAELENVGARTDPYGYYVLKLRPGTYTLQFRGIGFEDKEVKIDLTSDVQLDLELAVPSEIQNLSEVKVSAKKENENITSGTPGEIKLEIEDIKKLPTFGGEVDIVEVAKRQPGFKTAGEGNAGYYVRGGGLDQNLVLLDEAPIYNPSHLLGFFSVFNGDAVKGATIYKGGIPAEYGGRTASVMDIRMKDGNAKRFGVSGGLGLIASRLTLEGPIVKDKGSFMLSGRRTYADLLLKLSDDPSLNSTQLYFYDVNLKANYRLSPKDKIYLSGYIGRDRFGFQDAFGLNWGNLLGTLRWTHVFKQNLIMQTSLIYSDYDFEFGFGTDDDELSVQSVIRDINFKQGFALTINEKNKLKFGYNVIHHTIESGNIRAGSNTGINPYEADPDYGIEGALYVQNDHQISKRFKLNYGLRLSTFNQVGAGTAYEFDESGALLSTQEYGDWENIQFYYGLEPRLSANFVIDSVSSVKFGYNRNYQYTHLLSNATTSTPTDVWIMSSNNVKPQIADQLSLGYYRNFSDNMYETSVEIYYKDMQNVIDYRTGASTFLNEELEGDLIYGDGESYGIEFFVRKRKGKLTGFAGYTLSRSLRQFDEINGGEKFSARQDRIHDFSISAMYDITDRLSVSANFVYYTGDAVTFPTGKYEVEGMQVPHYSERNGYRMPDYHRLDLALTWQNKKKKRFESSWNFSVYNVYGRENAYSISFEQNEDNPAINEAVQLSLFKWVPTITYNFKF